MRTRQRLLITTLLISAVSLGALSESGWTQGTADQRAASGLDEERGLRINSDDASSGYILFTGLLSDTTYLINNLGQVVHTWKSELGPAGGAYLLDNGHLVRGGRAPELRGFSGGGQGGRVQEFTWDGKLVLDFSFNSGQNLLHHDIEVLPNGNILAIAWASRSAAEARRAGRRTDLIPERGLWPDIIVEFRPYPPHGARIVWEWRAWDHMIQDFDPTADNFGVVAEHPELIDINGDVQAPSPEELEQIRRQGFVGSEEDAEPATDSDLMHSNAVAYHPGLDQILISVHDYHELWVIDHSTSTEEAAGHSGGRYGRGGDLLYRWGNPRAYGRGSEADRKMGGQHDARWIPDGMPGAGHIMVFSNNAPGPDGPYTIVYEIAPPMNSDGHYELPGNRPFGPTESVWSYSAPEHFRAGFISGAHRLANGSTLITSGPRGRFMEVTPQGEITWEYWTPYAGQVLLPDGARPQPVGLNVFAVFRATRIPPDHPALAGRDLAPLNPQPPIIPPIFPEG